MRRRPRRDVFFFTQAKHAAQKRFWETRDFDPLLGRYYDAGKEADYGEQRDALSTMAGRGKTAALPPAVQYCEGAAYNVISHEVRDDEKLAVARAVGDSAVASKRGAAVDAAIRSRAARHDARDKSRALARFAKTASLKEREDGRHHGYRRPRRKIFSADDPRRGRGAARLRGITRAPVSGTTRLHGRSASRPRRRRDPPPRRPYTERGCKTEVEISARRGPF